MNAPLRWTASVVEIYDEQDDLVGFAVLLTRGTAFRVESTVYGTRSEAHTAAAKFNAA